MNRLGLKELGFALFALATIAWALWVNPDGYLGNDEAIYHLMTSSLIHEGKLFVWNGFEEFPSLELRLPQTRIYNGHLYPQYPVFFAVLASPFVAVLGFKGFYLLNAIALLATVVLCHRLAKALFGDADLAANACLIFLFATYAWEYGQAARPHAVSVCLVTLSAYLAIVAYRSSALRNATAVALGAGLVAGLGVGVRLDTVLVLPAIIVPFLLARPWRPREALAIGIGAVPALAILALTNDLKFGVLSPLSYGALPSPANVLASYVPIAILGVGGLAVIWLMTRQFGRDGRRTTRMILVGGSVLMAGAGVFLLDLWDYVLRLASGAYWLLVDFGIGETEALPPDASRGPAGTFLYSGGVKKALLQSCPYLAALAIPAAALARGAEDRSQLGLLFLVPGAFVIVYAYSVWLWHGDSAWPNTRFLLPVLPFTSILVAWAWRALNRGLSSRRSWPRLTVAAATTFVFLTLLVLSETTGESVVSLAVQEIMFRAIPLAIFVASLGLIMTVVISGDAAWPGLRGAAGPVLVAAFVWSGLTAFNGDYLRAFAVRQARAEVTASLTRVVEPDSILFTNAPIAFHRLLLERRVRIASPWRDQFHDFHALRAFHSERGRAIYVWLDPGMEEAVRDQRLFDNLDTVELFDLFGRGRLVQLVAPTKPADASSASPD